MYLHVHAIYRMKIEMKEAHIYHGVLWCFIHFNFSSYVIYKQHFFSVIAIIFYTEDPALHYINYKLHYITLQLTALQFVKTTHLEAVVQRVVANVLVDSNVTTLLDLVTLDVHQGTMEVNVKRVKSMTNYSYSLFTLSGLNFQDFFQTVLVSFGTAIKI